MLLRLGYFKNPAHSYTASLGIFIVNRGLLCQPVLLLEDFPEFLSYGKRNSRFADLVGSAGSTASAKAIPVV